MFLREPLREERLATAGVVSDRADSILIADDVAENTVHLARVLATSGYHRVHTTTNSRDVVSLFSTIDPDIVLLNPRMPGMDVPTVMRELQSANSRGAFLPIVVLSAEMSADEKRLALDAGASDFITRPIDPSEVVIRVRNLLALRRARTQLDAENRALEDRVRERTDALASSRIDVLEKLARAVEMRDDLTGEHTRRVGQLAGELAELLGEPAERVELIRRAAPVHDIGKIAIPPSILHKMGALTGEEMAIMQTHTTIGANVLAGGDNALVTTAERIAASHHERWDGLGYPNHLAGEAIPLEGRITAIADFFDSLTHDRPYRMAVPRQFVLLDIKKGSGTQFDPRIAEVVRDAPSVRGKL